MVPQTIKEGTILWEPTEEFKNQANITKYLRWLESEKGLSFQDYNSLWQWSVTEIEDFWQSLWEFFNIKQALDLAARVLIDPGDPVSAFDAQLAQAPGHRCDPAIQFFPGHLRQWSNFRLK